MAVRPDTNNVQILDHAAVPVVVGPNGKLMIALGMLLGLVLGSLIGVVTEPVPDHLAWTGSGSAYGQCAADRGCG